MIAPSSTQNMNMFNRTISKENIDNSYFCVILKTQINSDV